MISFVDNIEYLITKHDCVIIPSWGAFIAQYSHAYINEENQFISPKRTLSFNASISHNDGLLANSIMRKENKSYDTALSIISSEVTALKKQLHGNGEVAIGRLGFFISNEENQICFEPYANSMACNDFFGLKPISIKPIEKVEKAAKDNIINLDNSSNDNDVVYVPISRNIFRIAASIVILLGLSFMLSTPVVIDNQQEYASLNILASKQKAIEEINNRGDLFIAIPSVQVATEMIAEKVITNEVLSSPTTAKVETPKAKRTPRFYVIVASLHTRALAERHIKRANEAGLQILEKDGKFRIYIASTATSDEAYAYINKGDFKSSHADAWVCRK